MLQKEDFAKNFPEGFAVSKSEYYPPTESVTATNTN
jgi:hypothetical protein